MSDKSSKEILELVQKLSNINIKDSEKIKKCQKFKSFAKKTYVEFYDDDIPLLLIGVSEESDDEDSAADQIGLVQACGIQKDFSFVPSTHACISLLKWLVIDYDDDDDSSFNIFAACFRNLDLRFLKLMRFDDHVKRKDVMKEAKKGLFGSKKKEDIKTDIYILVKWLLVNWEPADGKRSTTTLELKHLLSSKESQLYFTDWLSEQNGGDDDLLNTNSMENYNEKDQDDGAGGDDNNNDDDGKLQRDEIDTGAKDKEKKSNKSTNERVQDVNIATKSELAKEELDNMGINLLPGAHDDDDEKQATTWADSLSARQGENPGRLDSDFAAMDPGDVLKYIFERERKRLKALNVDPMGLSEEGFDLASVDRAVKLCMSMLTKRKKETTTKSVLFTSSHFDPLLFLKFVHDDATYDELIHGLEVLSQRQSDQLERQQNLVRDNFDLFVKAATGVDALGEEEVDSDGNLIPPYPIFDEVDSLKRMADDSMTKARDSFKPLVDNSNEVRKTKAALTLLRRISSYMAIPSQMRVHIDAGNFTAAIKLYGKVLALQEECDVNILKYIKEKAGEAARDARFALEKLLKNSNAPVSKLVECVGDLETLISLQLHVHGKIKNKSKGEQDEFDQLLNSCPAITCLAKQAEFFESILLNLISETDTSISKISADVKDDDKKGNASAVGLINKTLADAEMAIKGIAMSLGQNHEDDEDEGRHALTTEGQKNWRYALFECRHAAVTRGVAIAKSWIPRLVRLGVTARESEVFLALAKERDPKSISRNLATTAFEAFIINVSPLIEKLVNHIAFCAVGTENEFEIRMTVGNSLSHMIQSQLKEPLPPQINRMCSKELSDMLRIFRECVSSISILKPDASYDLTFINKRISVDASSLQNSALVIENAVVIVERRYSVYALDQCATECAKKASNAGIFDIDKLLTCIHQLDNDLSEPRGAAFEIEKGCQLVVIRTCEAMLEYANNRDTAKAVLQVVCECAKSLDGSLDNLVQEVSSLIESEADKVEEALTSDVIELEARMFEKYMKSIRNKIGKAVKVGWVTETFEEFAFDEDFSARYVFPGYLSSSLLCLVRCKAEVDEALGEMTRLSTGASYAITAIRVAVEECLLGICKQLSMKMKFTSKGNGERYMSELYFLTTLLSSYLGDEANEEVTRRIRELNMAGNVNLQLFEHLKKSGCIYWSCLKHRNNSSQVYLINDRPLKNK